MKPGLEPRDFGPKVHAFKCFHSQYTLPESVIPLIFVKTCAEHKWPFRNSCFYFLFSIVEGLLGKRVLMSVKTSMVQEGQHPSTRRWEQGEQCKDSVGGTVSSRPA